MHFRHSDDTIALMRRGLYIVLEGGEHVGKSTQAARLAERNNARLIREPGTTKLGEAVRELLLDPGLEKQPETQVLLHAAQRAELARTVIQPTVAAGQDIVSDRSWISSAAYQGVQGVPLEEVYRINRFALGELIKPDICILLDADPEEVASRTTDASPDYYEGQGNAFHAQLRRQYLEIANEMGAYIVNALHSVEEVAQQIQEHVDNHRSFHE